MYFTNISCPRTHTQTWNKGFMNDPTPLLDAVHFDIFYYYYFFFLSLLQLTHWPLNGHAHSLKSTAVGLELGTMDSSTKMWVPVRKKERRCAPGREAASLTYSQVCCSPQWFKQDHHSHAFSVHSSLSAVFLVVWTPYETSKKITWPCRLCAWTF